MPGEGFAASIEATESGPVIQLSGTVNRVAKELLEAAYEEATAIDGEMKFDFTGVDYINSTGIAVIVGLLAKARASGRKIGAFGLTDHYREVFEITRLSDFMTIYDDTRVVK